MMELEYKIWFHTLALKRSEKLFLLNKYIPEEIWHFSLKDYVNLGVGLITSEILEKSKKNIDLAKVCEYILKEGIKYISYQEEDYPEQLKLIYDPPIGLFVKGELPDLSNSIAIVGARNASDYGRTIAYKFASELSARGIVVISGMARGIDSSAHRGTLDSCGKTVAVMGSGFKHIYPPQNSKLFWEIIKNGCIITEYLPDTIPYAFNFPERNRIISALANFVLVVEAGEKSGSLITANLALEQGKDVFAVPGNILSSSSVGTNKLIKDGAKVITCVDDIIEEFKMGTIQAKIIEVEAEELEILDYFKTGGVNIEYILQNCSISPSVVLTILSKLEFKGLIKRMYGNYYIACQT